MKVPFKFFLTIAALGSALSTVAQVLPDVPFMWVPIGADTVARNKFSQGGYPNSNSASKLTIFNNAVGSGHPVSYSYSVAAIDQLITLVTADDAKNQIPGTGIRLHFAAYHAATAPTGLQMGSTKDKQVIPIFSGSLGGYSADVPIYYVISPVDQTPHVISSAVMQDWCNYYYSTEDNATGLVSTLEPGSPPEDIYGTTKSDTRSEYYDMDDFVEFLQTERNYQNTDPDANPSKAQIDHIGIYFADYSNNGIGANPWYDDETLFKDRLFVLWEFISNGNIYYIDKAPNFCQRPGAVCGGVVNPTLKLSKLRIPKAKLEKLKLKMFGGNNGQLCPPSCP
jgi:hypothetical protein